MSEGSTAAEALNGFGIDASMTVNDLQKSMDWYQNVLGFVVERKHERDGKFVAVSLKAGEAHIVLGQDDGAKGRDRVKGVAISLRITTDQDIDERAAMAKAAGGVLDVEPSMTPWGTRMFRIKDPDGFTWSISSR